MKKYTKKSLEKRKKEREGFSEFYKEQCAKAATQVKYCENCGRALQGNVSEIAHILPKRIFKSVATNPKNVLYLCSNLTHKIDGCHDRYDSTWSEASQMDVWPQALERYMTFRNLIESKKNKSYRFFEDEIRKFVPEEWSWIDGCESYYKVSNKGNVQSFHGKRPILLKTKFDRYGYVQCQLNLNGDSQDVTVHRLVAKHFVDNPDNKTQVNHINYDKTDNFYLNLEWVDVHENQFHKQLNNEKKTSKYVGVRLHSGDKYQARVTFKGKTYHLGLFDNEMDAKLAYNKAKSDFFKKGKLPK